MLIDSSQLFREGLKGLLRGTAIEVTSEASSVTHVSEMEDIGTLDLVILDFYEKEQEGAEHLKLLRNRFASTKIVILTSELSTPKLVEALSYGVDGYLLKNMSADALVQSLDLVLLGEKVFPTYLAHLLIDERSGENRRDQVVSLNGLSERELQILQCLANGDPNKVIANRLNITEATVKVHIKGVLKKIPASNRTQAAVWAIENGIEPRELAASNL